MALESLDYDFGDKRVPVSDTGEIPHSGVAHLVISMMNDRHIGGTGFLVHVANQFVIVTAAHNLYDKSRGKAQKVVIYLGRDLEKYHHGVILKKDIDIEVPYEHKEGQNAKEDAKEGVRQMKVQLTKPKVTDKFIFYKDATFYGSSGSPIYTIQDNTHIAVGIHIQGFSHGFRFNKGILITKIVKSCIENLVQELMLADWGSRRARDLFEERDLLHRRPHHRSSYHETEERYYRPLQRSTSETNIRGWTTEAKTPTEFNQKFLYGVSQPTTLFSEQTGGLENISYGGSMGGNVNDTKKVAFERPAYGNEYNHTKRTTDYYQSDMQDFNLRKLIIRQGQCTN